ncbi:MAG TPA: hypothetical protein VM328_09045 [Fimbriimonadaceae bacterium]|nr:hypothetical protein [Fimbriimonadaceae bacterium]
MRESGRLSLLPVLGVIFAIVIVALLFVSGENPSTAAREFMNALATSDIETLTKRSYIEGNSREEIKKKWEFTMNEVAPYYRFAWQVRSHKQVADDQATVNLGFVRGVGSLSAYEEKFELPMVRKDGEWLVDLRGIERKKFPGLPR